MFGYKNPDLDFPKETHPISHFHIIKTFSWRRQVTLRQIQLDRLPKWCCDVPNTRYVVCVIPREIRTVNNTSGGSRIDRWTTWNNNRALVAMILGVKSRGIPLGICTMEISKEIKGCQCLLQKWTCMWTIRFRVDHRAKTINFSPLKAQGEAF